MEAAMWIRVFDRGGKILFALTTALVLMIEVWQNGLDRFYAILLCGGLGFIMATLLNAGIKWVFKKQRPLGEIKRTTNLLAPLMQYSFPSFHAQLAFTMTLVASWFFWTIHWGFAIFFVLLAIVTSYTRYKLKAHDMIDIIGGALIGLLTGVLICYWLYGFNNLYAAIAVVGLSILLFFYIPERYFSRKNKTGLKPEDHL